MYRSLIGILVVAFSLACNANAEGKFNAVWNTSGPKGVVGFWIYPISGSCSYLRENAQPLVIGAEMAKTKQKHSELWLCFKLPQDHREGPNNCRSGSLSFQFNEAANTYIGEYSLELVKGGKIEGKFYAQSCPKL